MNKRPRSKHKDNVNEKLNLALRRYGLFNYSMQKRTKAWNERRDKEKRERDAS